ncbi:hypothetical protein AB0B10_25300 [Micromonospora arborensis]|uniref:hypothetical protein n=1 Tax=Micromonospora arborensis TaxID=2116518 RepID=UPI0034002AC9
MDVVGRWWNGSWGRIARRDIWLLLDGRRWCVRGRVGGDDGREVLHEFDDEQTARAMVSRMMGTSAGAWRDLTEALHQETKHLRGD